MRYRSAIGLASRCAIETGMVYPQVYWIYPASCPTQTSKIPCDFGSFTASETRDVTVTVGES